MDHKITQVQLSKPGKKDKDQATPKLFTFDGVYYTEDTTRQIYEEMGFPLVSGVLDGYNGTVFAYGQTGCGKSFSMMGVETPVENKGIIPRAFEHIFDHVAVTSHVKFLVRASYLEIYNEEVICYIPFVNTCVCFSQPLRLIVHVNVPHMYMYNVRVHFVANWYSFSLIMYPTLSLYYTCV